MKISIKRHFKADREILFPLVTNTALFIKEAGFKSVKINNRNEKGRGAFIAASERMGMMRFVYNDIKNDWIAPVYYEKQRDVVKGPVKHISMIFRLKEKDRGTEVETELEMQSAGMMGMMMMPMLKMMMKKSVHRFLDRVDGLAAVRGAQSEKEQPVMDEKLYKSLLKYKEKMVRLDWDEEGVEDWFRKLASFKDEQLVNINPFAIAGEMDVDRVNFLKLYLAATKAGIFDLNWNVRCPSCRSIVDHYRALSAVDQDTRCDMCDIDFQNNFDESIEVSFDLQPSIKQIDKTRYCAAYPAEADDIKASIKLSPGETKNLTTPFAPGKYFFYHPKYPHRRSLEVSAAEKNINADEIVVYGSSDVESYDTIRLGSADVLSFVNNSKEHIDWKLTRVLADRDWVSAAYITSINEFRDLFSSEILSADASMAIKNISLMFTDIKGSTSMYEKIGDASAYRHVRDHFTLMKELVSEYNGAIVKTIGDSVMAAFMDSLDAVEAGVRMHETFEEFNNSEGIMSKINIKIGIHSGPVIAVNRNDKIDYFGTTVNKAARLEGKSKGGDIVISKDIFDKPRVRNFLKELRVADSSIRISHFQADLKGLSSKGDLYRIQLLEI